MKINYVIPCGWVLLFAGLGLIICSVNTSYNYFMAKAQFPAVIGQPAAQNKVVETGAGTADLTDNQAVQALLQTQIQNSVDQTLGNMIPAGSVAVMLNAAIWSVFATFLVYAGVRISGIGVKMLTGQPEKD